MNLCLFFEKGLFGFLVRYRDSEIDGLIEKDFLLLRAIPACLCNMFMVVSFPLYEEKAREFDVSSGLLKVCLKGDII